MGWRTGADLCDEQRMSGGDSAGLSLWRWGGGASSGGRLGELGVGAARMTQPSDDSNLRLRVPLRRVGPVEVPVPRYQTTHAAGMDLQAAIEAPLLLRSLERALVPTGFAMAIPIGWEGQVRPRSGLAAKRGITVINTPGTIDADYRGEVKVCLVNLSAEPVTIEPLERIAQVVFARHGTATLDLVTELDETARGVGGYGSTGR
jgi:dUTP pyrophosphatase